MEVAIDQCVAYLDQKIKHMDSNFELQINRLETIRNQVRAIRENSSSANNRISRDIQTIIYNKLDDLMNAQDRVCTIEKTITYLESLYTLSCSICFDNIDYSAFLLDLPSGPQPPIPPFQWKRKKFANPSFQTQLNDLAEKNESVTNVQKTGSDDNGDDVTGHAPMQIEENIKKNSSEECVACSGEFYAVRSKKDSVSTEWDDVEVDRAYYPIQRKLPVNPIIREKASPMSEFIQSGDVVAEFIPSDDLVVDGPTHF